LFIVGFGVDVADEVFFDVVEVFVVAEEESFVVDVEIEEVFVVAEEESFVVDVGIEEVFIVVGGGGEEGSFGIGAAAVFDVSNEEFFKVELDEGEVFLDNVVDDEDFELSKFASDDVVETGSEDDDKDDSGRLSLSFILSCVIECFEDERDKLLIAILRNEIKCDMV
jgi:hypothetical protein